MRLQPPIFLLLLFFPACGEKIEKNVAIPLPKSEQIQISDEGILGSTIEDSEQLARKAEEELDRFAETIVSGSLPKTFAAPEEWNRIAESFTESSPESRYAKAYVFDVHYNGGHCLVSARIELKAHLIGGNYLSLVTQMNASWKVTRDGSIEIKSLSAPRATQFKETPKLWFSDETNRVAGQEPAFTHHLAHGLDYWLSRVESIHGIDTFISNGMAVGDFNGDGLEDVYVCQPGGLPNRLLIHQPNGSVREASKETAVNYLDHTSAALFLDIDNDGDQDLSLATPTGIVLLENDEGKAFRSRGILQTDDVDCHSLTATDFDLDGNLDLFITFALGSPIIENSDIFRFHDARDGGSNQLFKGDGKWSFSEVTAPTGLNEGNNRHSLAASWHDYDLDGDPDLYVANDYGENQLYRNDLRGGIRSFIEIAKILGVEDRGAGMSASWGDYNRDGLPDLYVGNMFSNAGKRVTGQADFLPSKVKNLASVYRRFAKGNTLFSQKQNGKFIEFGSDVEVGRWAWSSVFADLDNDGWQDLFIANGYISGPQPDDL